jgi:hypothetical protein
MENIKQYIHESLKTYHNLANIYSQFFNRSLSNQNDNRVLLNYFLPNDFQSNNRNLSDTLNQLFDYIMIRRVLKYAFETSGEYKIRYWKHRDDDDNMLDFIVDHFSDSIGITFQASTLLEAKRILKKNRLKSLIILSFCEPPVDPNVLPDYIQVKSFNGFFTEMYSQEVADIFYIHCKEASQFYMSILHQKTIPLLNNEYLASFRQEIKNEYLSTHITQYYSVEKENPQ